MITALLVLLCVSSLEDWESIRLRGVGMNVKNQGSDEKCYNMRQGVR